MQNINFEGLTKQEVIDALHFKEGTRELSFRYELLDVNDNKIKDLNNVLGGEVTMSSLATIQRSARLDIVDDDNSIDWLNNRIKVYARLKVKDIWVEYSLGIFMLTTPARAENNGIIYRNVTVYDELQILLDDKTDSRYTVLTGQNYVSSIVEILKSAGIDKYNIDNSEKQCPVSKEWDIGTSKLVVINDLLSELNYTSLWVDEQGYFTSHKYVLPTQRAPEYIYSDNDMSIIGSNVEHEIDYFKVANKWIVVSSNPDSLPLISTYINSNIMSQTSTVNRGRTIVDFRKIDNIADQNALNDYCNRIAFEASQIYENIKFQTAIMPFHSFNDAIGLQYSKMGVDDKYIETSWTIPLSSGSMMKHEARRVVQI